MKSKKKLNKPTALAYQYYVEITEQNNMLQYYTATLLCLTTSRKDYGNKVP